MRNSRSEDELKVPSQRSDETRGDEDKDLVDETGGGYEDRDPRARDPRVREEAGSGQVRHDDGRFGPEDRTGSTAGAGDTAGTAGTGDYEGTRHDEGATQSEAAPQSEGSVHGEGLAHGEGGGRSEGLGEGAGRGAFGRRDEIAHAPATHGYASTAPGEDDDEPPYKDPYASTGPAGDLPADPERDNPLGRGADRDRDPDPAHTGIPADEAPGYETSRDTLPGTTPHPGEHPEDKLVHSGRSTDDQSHGGWATGEQPYGGRTADEDPHDGLADGGPADDGLAHNEPTEGVPTEGGPTDHRPTDGRLTDGRLTDGGLTDGGLTDGGRSGEKGPADDVPSHAAPLEVGLFDQDPAQVQARWRDLQASFVDDPAEAIQHADGLVGEVVESLTNSLTSRTDALRERWKDVDSPDTEDLRQAFRDYRNVLERLLALSTHGSSQETRR
ncbi:hypothetical protein ACFFV7_25185 [Nonomuraea spiralis]|uniref:Uncharacterized protein n=1 Tax=Nonomuraea spiralis TaxID=46182 RepID=A0ABV5IJ43_9ACTN|nr:hypothetical protein [Nonomuraea spiralis]GGT29207.1 hypothetical protein GCM10010176_087390 [Nonomuraea spiralis]